MPGARCLACSSLLVTLVLLSIAGCARPENATTVAGSTSVQPFAEMLAEQYMTQHPTEQINVQGGGSSAGIEAVLSGAAAVGMSSRELRGDETKLTRIQIARDAIAVIVHPSNPIRDLTLEQVRGIFSGKVTRWLDVGGPDRPIYVVTREEGSGTRAAFQELVLGSSLTVDTGALVQDSNGAVRQLVSDDPSAIGYVSLGLVNDGVRAVSLGGVAPNAANVEAGRYKLVRPFLFVLRAQPTGPAKGFVDYVLSPAGQRALADEGLLGAEGAK